MMDNCSETGCSAGVDIDYAQMCEKCQQCFCDDHLYVAPGGIDGFVCDKCLLGDEKADA
jgi:hypothetical protein